MIVQNKVLFVDDERSLLNGIERRLGDDYDITTAECGADGLAAIEQHGPFPVIFTDMRMPRMDGVEFAEKGHALAPDSTFIMLTGNQDQTTAVRAVNEGRVFRFINKPCDSGPLRRAIEDGRRQHELITAEKELLHKTFSGAVSVLTDVIAASQANLSGLGQAVADKLDLLRQAGGIDDRWEFRLAAKLSPLGLSLMSEADRARVMGAPQWADETNASLADSLQTTANLIRGIPRLDTLADLCQATMSEQGAIAHVHPKSPSVIAEVGATLLRAALHWEILRRQGLNHESCSKEMEVLLPEINPSLVSAIKACDDTYDSVGYAGPSARVGLGSLKPGMVLANNISRDDGSCLIRQGKRLTSAMIQKLHETAGVGAIEVTEATLQGAV